MNEHDICKELITFVRLNEPRYPCLQWFYHVSNEGKRSPWKAAEVGLKSGVSDYHCPVPTARHRGLWLEMKALGKKPTQAQENWLQHMRKLGYLATWCDSLQSAFSVVESYAKEATEWMKQNK